MARVQWQPLPTSASKVQGGSSRHIRRSRRQRGVCTIDYRPCTLLAAWPAARKRPKGLLAHRYSPAVCRSHRALRRSRLTGWGPMMGIPLMQPACCPAFSCRRSKRLVAVLAPWDSPTCGPAWRAQGHAARHDRMHRADHGREGELSRAALLQPRALDGQTCGLRPGRRVHPGAVGPALRRESRDNGRSPAGTLRRHAWAGALLWQRRGPGPRPVAR